MSSVYDDIIPEKNNNGIWNMKTRKKDYGNCNIIGKNAERLRKSQRISQKDFIAKLQLFGLDVNPTSYSKLEGQIRIATDKEVRAIAGVLKVDVNELFKD